MALFAWLSDTQRWLSDTDVNTEQHGTDAYVNAEHHGTEQAESKPTKALLWLNTKEDTKHDTKQGTKHGTEQAKEDTKEDTTDGTKEDTKSSSSTDRVRNREPQSDVRFKLGVQIGQSRLWGSGSDR